MCFAKKRILELLRPFRLLILILLLKQRLKLVYFLSKLLPSQFI